MKMVFRLQNNSNISYNNKSFQAYLDQEPLDDTHNYNSVVGAITGLEIHTSEGNQ